MKKIILFFLLCFFANWESVFAEEFVVNVYASSSDATVLLYDDNGITDWSVAREYQGNILRSGEEMLSAPRNNVRSDMHSRFFRIYRSSIPFDVDLPENAEITEVSLNLSVVGAREYTDVSITSHNRDNLSIFTQEDWQIGNFGSILFAEEKPLVTGEVTSFDFNSEGIKYVSENDYPTLGLLTYWDFNNILPPRIPTGATWHSADAEDISLRPYLEITYTLPEEPKKTIEELFADLGELVDGLDNVWIKRFVEAQLRNAERSYKNGRIIAMTAQLNTIERQIKRFVDRGRIDEEKGAEIVATKKELLSAITAESEEEAGNILLTQIASPLVPGSEEWADDVYGNGEFYDCGTTIAACGCAITSLAMIARNHGIETGVDGTEVNPGNFNAWLQANNGYTATNNLDWIIAMRYFADKDGRSTLDFATHNEKNQTVIRESVENNGPAIAYDSAEGHYLVLDTLLETDDYNVKDPWWYNTKTLNDSKDVANKVQNYNGDIDRANLFSFKERPELLSSGLTAHLASPAELLVIDDQGRRTGYDPETGTILEEIPNSSYVRDEQVLSGNDVPAGSHPRKVLSILDLDQNMYDMQVIGTGEGDYTLTVSTAGQGADFETSTTISSTTPDQVDEYVIEVPQQKRWLNAVRILRKLADRARREEVADRLNEIADQLEERNIARVEAGMSQWWK